MTKRVMHLLSCIVVLLGMGNLAALAFVDEESAGEAVPEASGGDSQGAPSPPIVSVPPGGTPSTVIGTKGTPAADKAGGTTPNPAAPPSATQHATPGAPDAPPPRPGLELRAEVVPACATRTGKLKVTIRTVPRAHLAFSMAYADGKHHGQQATGQANRDGVQEYTWTVPAEAASGEGRFLVSGYDAETHKGGTASVPFTVADLAC